MQDLFEFRAEIRQELSNQKAELLGELPDCCRTLDEMSEGGGGGLGPKINRPTSMVPFCANPQVSSQCTYIFPRVNILGFSLRPFFSYASSVEQTGFCKKNVVYRIVLLLLGGSCNLQDFGSHWLARILTVEKNERN